MSENINKLRVACDVGDVVLVKNLLKQCAGSDTSTHELVAIAATRGRREVIEVLVERTLRGVSHARSSKGVVDHLMELGRIKAGELGIDVSLV